ncbi:LOW QUALITY PROTEIN: F-box protein At1g10780 [Camellia sinensis]|nr:LOW QUALITY PROTEIN: F-box protein At1g10780 [Camellia sinensis]
MRIHIVATRKEMKEVRALKKMMLKHHLFSMSVSFLDFSMAFGGPSAKILYTYPDSVNGSASLQSLTKSLRHSQALGKITHPFFHGFNTLLVRILVCFSDQKGEFFQLPTPLQPQLSQCAQAAGYQKVLPLLAHLHNSHQTLLQQVVGARLEDPALSDALQACPNLTHLSLLACEGLRSVSIELPQLEQCRLDFYGLGNCSLSIVSPKLELLEVQGCSWIRVRETQCLRNLSIANNSGRVYMVDFGKLVGLEFLSIRGVQWCWDAISKMLQLANKVKHLYMKVEFTGDFEALLPFPEIDFVEFFNSHPKLRKFDMHGAMFAALCQKNSLKNVDSRFVIPCLEEAVVTVRSPLNAEQKMSTLESLVKYGKNLKKMTVRILDMKSSHSSADDFFQEICRFRCLNRKIVSIE